MLFIIVLLLGPRVVPAAAVLAHLASRPTPQVQSAAAPLDDQATGDALREAIKLHPESAPAYDALARFYLVRPDKLDQAHEMAIRAIQLAPGDLRYRLTVANILLKQKKFSVVITVMENARPLAKTADEKSAVNTFIQQAQDGQAAEPPTSSGTTVLMSINGQAIDSTGPAPDAPPLPPGPPRGLHHTVRGVLHGARCFYPTVLTVSLQQPAGTLSLYSNNYFKVPFTTVGFTPTGNIDPCKTLEGMKARVIYSDVKDKTVAGQIVSVELSK